MGLLKTQELDNGEIGFECIYGGLEAPFGGIDASRASRYIDPKCFADASNFLIIDNELCLCQLDYNNILPPPTGIVYPMAGTSTEPGVLLGVGRLPCENIDKNWALYASPAADSNTNWTYMLMLWYSDGSGVTTETYYFTLVGQQILAPPQNAVATLTVEYAYPLSANASIATSAVPPLNPYGGGTPVTPPTYDGFYYERSQWNPTISGTPTPGSGQAPYLTHELFDLWNNLVPQTPSSGPVTLPKPSDVAATIASYINQLNAGTGTESWGMPCVAAVSATNPNTVTLTAKTPPYVDATTGLPFPPVEGAAGNSIVFSGQPFSKQFGYFPPTALQAMVIVPATPIGGGSFPYYAPNPFTSASFIINVTPFSGGTAGGQIIYSNTPIQQLTYETVGNNLFLAGWPAGYMLQYNDTTKQFYYLTQYQGARVLKKLAGHLISVGMINSAAQTETNTHLWFNWTATGIYSQWNAQDSTTNLPTGAGGSQLADISDQLTGLIISNSVAFILRAEGLSYASPQQTSTLPFVFNHVALCKDGQGCPSTSLWTQFDQVGFYIGQTNVFMLSQSPQAVGDSIWPMMYPSLAAVAFRLSDPPPPFTYVDNPPPFLDQYYNKVNVEPLIFPRNNRAITQFAVNLAGIIFLYDPISGTWMKFNSDPMFPTETQVPNMRWSILKCASVYGNGTHGYLGSYQNKESGVYGQAIKSGLYQAPYMLSYIPGISFTQSAHVWFPQEEIAFGRDITVDAIYILAAGLPGTEVDFTIDGWQGNPSTFVTAAYSGKLIFSSAASPQNFEEYQVFNSDGSAITLKAPQLKLNIPAQNISYTPPVPYPVVSDSYVKIAKIAMFGKFDPRQRPV